MENYEHGLLFDPALSAEIKERFCYVDADPEFGKRLFFENSGGSLRLKASVEEQAKYQAFPDCPERVHARSKELKRIQLRGIDDVMHVVFGASGRRAADGDDRLPVHVPDGGRHSGELPGYQRRHLRAGASLRLRRREVLLRKDWQGVPCGSGQSQNRRHRPRGDPPAWWTRTPAC